MDAEQRRALREEVARRVMGWRAAERKWAYSAKASLWHAPDGEPRMPVQSWRPDEDDGQCMAVAERMVEIGYALELEIDPDGAHAGFSRDGGEPSRVVHQDRRIALLQAALAALGDESDLRVSPPSARC